MFRYEKDKNRDNVPTSKWSIEFVRTNKTTVDNSEFIVPHAVA